MLRVRIAVWLLRTTGAQVEYGVRRVKSTQVRGKGSTVLASSKLKDAIAKYKAMRIADTDAITITVAAIVAQRHGTVTSKGEKA